MSLIPLLILFAVCGIDGHGFEDVVRQCVHSQYIEPQLERLVKTIESIPLETHRAANAYFNPVPARSLLQADEDQPIRIHIDYQLESIPPDKVRFMKEKLMPAVLGVFQRAINVRKPVKGRFYLPYACVSSFIGFPNYCHEVGFDCGTARHNRNFFGRGRTCIQPYDDQCTDLPQGDGVDDADFILYVTAHADAGCLSSSETVASAGFCTYDMDNWYGLPGRPLAGVANFCPSNIYLEEDMFGYMLDTAVHEVLHALVMSKQLFERFIDSREQVRTDGVVEREGSLTVQTPAVVRAARSILGCPTLTGAKLENEGGYGTADSHWERRVFIGEIMIGSSSASKRVVFSNLTLALAEDSGWYIPKYSHSGVLSSIEHRGCGFVEQDCSRYHKDLEETFCWNELPADQQPAVCTPDHMAIGYCKNDMSLMGDCNIVQPFKNTHCTEVEHEPETQHVDLAMRHKPGARCIPVESYKISRTENFFTVYRSDLGAACFDIECKGRDLYVKIPATPYHEGKDIRCPTGGFVDLTDYGLGFDEGTIGPCPRNDLLCESWGCPNDCSSNGRCFEGKCFCDIGYVGESCSDLPCPQNPCVQGEICQIEEGICFPGGFGSRPTETKGGEEEPPSKPPKPPSKRSDDTLPMSHPKESKPKKSAPGEEPYVPFTEPKKPRTRPLKSPVIEQAPEKAPPDVYDVPAYIPSGESFAGRAAAVGYLSNCLVFEDSYGDLRIRPETVRRYTKDFGEWELDPFPKEDEFVVDPDYGQDCFDIFTNMRPLWRLRGFRTVRTLSGISTLVALTPTPLESENNSTELAAMAEDEWGVHNKYSRYALEQQILKALGLKDKFILQRDFITETYTTKDKEARRAVVYNAMISNTVLQVSCFVDVSTRPSYRISDLVFRTLGQLLSGGLDLSKLVYTDTVYILVERLSNGVLANDRNAWLVSEAVAASNQLTYDSLSKYKKGIDILDAMARLTYIAQTEICAMAAGLEAGDVDWIDFQDETSRHNLQKMANAASIPDVAVVMSEGLEQREDVERENLRLDIPYVNTELKETAFIGILIGIVFITSCILFGCCCRKRAFY